MPDPTPLEGALMILRQLDVLEQRLSRMEESLDALLPFFEHILEHLRGTQKAPAVPVASFGEMYGAANGKEEDDE